MQSEKFVLLIIFKNMFEKSKATFHVRLELDPSHSFLHVNASKRVIGPSFLIPDSNVVDFLSVRTS